MSIARGDGGNESGGRFESRVYAHRFTGEEVASKRLLWAVLTRNFFQGYCPQDARVLDLGAGNCEFINEIHAKERIAVDVNPDTEKHASSSVKVIRTLSTDLSAVPSGSVDVVFTSNFFEHLPDKDSLLRTLDECYRVLRPQGRLLVLMPNLRYLPGAYWDYLDHHLPLTHLSLQEAIELTGFSIDEVIPRFLPYTVRRSKLPIKPWIIRTYLNVKPAWIFFGKQMFIAASKRDTHVPSDGLLI